MANVALVQSATIQDGRTIRRVTEVYSELVDTTTLAQLAAAQGTWLTDLDAIIDGAIVENRVTIKPALPGGIKAVGTGATFVASRTSQIGLFRFSATGSSAAWSSAVPSFSNAAVIGDAIDTGNADVAAYSALLIGGGYTNRQNQDLTGLEKTALTTRRP